ncbi:hypothetical protein KBD45_00105 [Candidatus Dojkabacteria bacterium]|nr:hypothetical protein [Candidatus Dojkabacteria bacterium]
MIIYFVSNLFGLQIINGNKYLSRSILNNYSKKVITPQRGKIYDINQNIIADNIVRYDVLIDRSVYQVGDILNLVEIFRGEDDFRNYVVVDENIDIKNMELSNEDNNAGNFLVLKGLSKELYDKFFNKYGTTKGLVGYENWERDYVYPYEFSSILGYLGEPDKDDLESDDLLANYKKIGKAGVEEFYNKFLVGQVGERIVFESIEGRYDELVIKNQKVGSSLYLTINKDWQILLSSLLEQQMHESNAYGAAGVVMESKTGEMKALVSLPSFDANLFNKGLSEEDFQELLDDPKKPLLNKAISTKISPGSTIKPILALFAFNDKIIDPAYKYYSKGCEDLGTNITFCEADRVSLGEVDFSKSIYKSSNLYYCSIARLYETEYASQDLQYVLNNFDQLGSTNLVGIDIKGEVISSLPSLERTQKNYGRDWSIGDMCNTFIGQGDLALTPVKMLSFMSMIDNNGKIYQPHLVKQIMNEEGELILENLPIEKYNFEVGNALYFDIVKGAMKKTISESGGSARLLSGLDKNLMVKTGSADAKEVLGNGTVLEGAHSWVVGIFEREGVSYSFAIVQFFGGRGFQTVPVIGNFINCLDNKDEKECIIY